MKEQTPDANIKKKLITDVNIAAILNPFYLSPGLPDRHSTRSTQKAINTKVISLYREVTRLYLPN